MKKVYKIKGFYDVNEVENNRAFHSEYVFTGEEGVMEVSDGYHTMDELYQHRHMLYVALCRGVAAMDVERGGTGRVWKSRKNSDGSEWDGWFLLGIDKGKDEQISYHLPEKLWEVCSFAEELEVGLWDGHTSNDVLIRLLKLKP